MKRIIFLFILVTLAAVFALAACSQTFTSTSSSSNSSAASTDQQLSQAAEQAVGTFKLEGTKLAVDAQEAANLLPLWQAYVQLVGSNTAAQAEIDAVLAQIQSTMTLEQVQAITALKLTGQDEFSTMIDLGLAMNSNNASGTGTPVASSNQGFPVGGAPAGGPSGGSAPAGGPPSDSGGGFVGGGSDIQLDPTQLATLQAGRTLSGGQGNRVPTALLNALIDLLQKRAQP